MQFLLNDLLIQSGQSLDDVKNILKEYEFKETVPEHSEEIIFHGKTILRSIEHEIAIHMYFSKDTFELQSMVIHPFPLNFNKIQTYLEKQFGKVNHILEKTSAEWIFEGGKVIHQILDRWGEEEMIFIEFRKAEG